MKKTLKWIGIIFLLLLAFLLAAPFLFKDKIISKIKEEANKNLNAKFDFESVDLSLIRSFPNLTVNLSKLSIINLAPFENDTLIYADNLDVTLDIMSVIKGSEMKIKKINLDKPLLNFLVNKDGKANWDIAKSSAPSQSSSSQSPFKASLQKYTINKGVIVYDDQTMPFYLKLSDLNHEGSGDFTQDLFILKTKTNIEKADMSYGGVKYVSGAKTEIIADLDMDMKNMKFSFKENKISLNELNLGVDGWVAMPDTNIDMDLKFNAAKSDFKNFISLIPAIYSANFKDIQSSGKMGFDGFIKGRYNLKEMPGFGINLEVDKGMFRYPSLPAAVENVFLTLKINNPDGIPDHTVINLSKMHLEMNKDPFDARLVLKNPVSDPDLDAFMKGKIDLSGISKLVPLEKGTSLSGIITADIIAIGKMSSIEQKRYEDFQASGNLGITSMNYSSNEMKQPVLINTLQVSLSPQNVNISKFIAKIGKSDFIASGTLDNVLAYALKGAKLKVTLNLNSQLIDMNEFMGSESSGATTTDSSAMSVIDVPENIDFTLNASIASLAYQNLILNNVKGAIIIKDKAIRMKDVGIQLMDGSMLLNGGYSSADLKKPNFDFAISIKDFDIQKTSKAFLSIQKLAPIAKHCTGKFSTEMVATSLLDNTMSPILNTLSGGGKLTAQNLVVSNFPVFSKIADVLKMDSWKQFTLQSINPSFKFVNGRVYIDPFDIKIDQVKSTVSGSNGFDQTIDYSMAAEIPRASLGGAANNVLNNLVASANSKGANLSLGDVVPINIKIGGTVNDPKVSTDISKSGGKLMDDLKTKAKEEFNNAKAAAEEKVKAEVEKAKNEAAAKYDAEKQKATAEADRIKKEAEAKAKAKTDSLKKAGEKKAKEELKKLNPFK